MMEDAESGMNDRLIVKVIGDTNAWIEISLLWILQLSARAAQTGNTNTGHEGKRRDLER